MIKKITILFLIAMSVSSCVSSKKIVYFQDINNHTQNEGDSPVSYETKLKVDDLLLIIVSAPDPLAAQPFNLPVAGVMNNSTQSVDMSNVQARFQSYLIDKEGNIQFPVLGKLKLGGLTRIEALAKLDTELKKYINEPTVNLRILNYKISVIGEVAKSGEFSLVSERVTLLEALSMAGDLTIYGNRNKVWVIREIDGVKTHNLIDLTSSAFLNSPYYYLTQNDVVYVEPNKTKMNSSMVGPNTTVIISALSLLLTTIALITR